MDNQSNNSILKVILYLAIALSFYSGGAFASDNLKVAVVDIQNVLDNSIAVAELRKSMDSIAEKLHNEMSEKEHRLKKLEADIVKKRGVIKDEEFDKEVNSFYKKVSETQHEMQQKKSKLEQAHAEAIKSVHKNTLEIIAELAKEKKFNVALPISQILYTDDNLTITKEVIQRLNKKVKSIKLNYK